MKENTIIANSIMANGDIQVKLMSVIIAGLVAWTSLVVYFTVTTTQLNDKQIFHEGTMAQLSVRIDKVDSRVNDLERTVSSISSAQFQNNRESQSRNPHSVQKLSAQK